MPSPGPCACPAGGSSRPHPTPGEAGRNHPTPSAGYTLNRIPGISAGRWGFSLLSGVFLSRNPRSPGCCHSFGSGGGLFFSTRFEKPLDFLR